MKKILLLSALMTAVSALGQTITEYRHWINDDVSTLVTTAVGSDTELHLIAYIDLPSLTKDYNHVTFQFKDSDGRYGTPYTTIFSRGTGAVNAYEYWVDDDIVNSTTTSVGPDGVVDLIADLPTGVPAGIHTFTIRFSGANGSWSVPLTTEFSSTVSIDELPGVTDLLLFPNPVNDQLGLRLHAVDSRNLSLRILDMHGAEVRDLSTWTVSGTSHRTWDISDMASGNYLLSISDDRANRAIGFVKP